jgi:hypothetical protein
VGAVGAVALSMPLSLALSLSGLDGTRERWLNSWKEPSQFLASIESMSPPDAVLLTDAPMFAFRAGRRVPPALVDLSLVRIGVDALTFQDLQTTVERDRPAAILFWGDRLKSVPGFYEWVDTHWIKKRAWGHSKVLYIDPQSQDARLRGGEG